MYTELIFGARLKKETPEQIINALKYIIGDIEEKPSDFPLPEIIRHSIFTMASYYFGVSKSINKMWFDDITKSWHIGIRSNIKNYKSQIEIFLNWIKPYIESGSGSREMYAIVIYEEDNEPTIYYLEDAEKQYADYY